MSSYTAVLNPSLTNNEGLYKPFSRVFTPGVSMNFNAASLQVVQRGAGANMSVDVSTGDAHLLLPSTQYSFYAWTDAATNVTITTANATNPRIDVIVAWVDTTVTTTAANNSPGSFKFQAMAGTPAGTPVAMTDTAIQAALGASIAWVKLAYVTVGAGVLNITTGNVTDARTPISSRVTAVIANGSVGSAQLAGGAVTASKLALGAQVASVPANESTSSSTYTDLATTTDSVTVTVPSTGMVLLLWSAETFGTTCFVSYAASGANTIAASDNNALISNATTAVSTFDFLIGLTPGSTTFKLKYHTSGSNGAFLIRKITAIPLG